MSSRKDSKRTHGRDGKQKRSKDEDRRISIKEEDADKRDEPSGSSSGRETNNWPNQSPLLLLGKPTTARPSLMESQDEHTATMEPGTDRYYSQRDYAPSRRANAEDVAAIINEFERKRSKGKAVDRQSYSPEASSPLESVHSVGSFAPTQTREESSGGKQGEGSTRSKHQLVRHPGGALYNPDTAVEFDREEAIREKARAEREEAARKKDGRKKQRLNVTQGIPEAGMEVHMGGARFNTKASSKFKIEQGRKREAVIEERGAEEGSWGINITCPTSTSSSAPSSLSPPDPLRHNRLKVPKTDKTGKIAIVDVAALKSPKKETESVRRARKEGEERAAAAAKEEKRVRDKTAKDKTAKDKASKDKAAKESKPKKDDRGGKGKKVAFEEERGESSRRSWR